MREIRINVSRANFQSGQTVEGYVVIDCDESFDCNRVVIRLRGYEKTRVVRGSGKHRRVYTEEHIHIDEKKVLKEFPIFQEGETGLDFKFEIPREVPASYEGVHGHIRYELKAKIELSWRLDPKDRMKIKVNHGTIEVQPDSQPVSSFVNDDGVDLLVVEALTNVISHGETLPFSFKVNREANIRGVRAEIIHKEYVAPKGKKETHERILTQSYIDDENLLRDSWIEMKLRTKSAWTPTFRSPLIKTDYVLKVTLDIPWRFDKSVKIPIRILPQGKPMEDEQTEEFDFGFEFE